MITLKKLNKKYRIVPKHHYSELEYYLRGTSLRKEIKNTRLYFLLKKLTSLAHPSLQEANEKCWESFYFPTRRSGHLCTVPFDVGKYKKTFWIHFFAQLPLVIKQGEEQVESIYTDIPLETMKFIHVLKKTGDKILDKTVPYDLRVGRIKGKHWLKHCITQKKYNKVLKNYEQHVAKQEKVEKISLKDYLNTCAICYKSAYKKAVGMDPLSMYKAWADIRHGGMLDIKNKESEEEFMTWLSDGIWVGSHPFEIVFSCRDHGIHLFPPRYSFNEETSIYRIRVSNYAYAGDYLKMVEALISSNIPFEAVMLKDILDYLAGKTYFTVNQYSAHYFDYIPCKEYKKKYFYKIEWEKLKVLIWKYKKKFKT